MKLLFTYNKVKAFDITKNGAQVIDHEGKIQVYNDPFCSIPLYITNDLNGEVIVFSDFENFYSNDSIVKDIDEVGFWEIVFFGSTLWTRTLYKLVMQMPAASCLTINKKTEQYSLKRYWNFSVKKDKKIRSMKQAADKVYLELDRIFSSLDKKKLYVLGMSGGMDSRITLAFLSKYIPKKNIKLVTYGYSDSILEYKFAKLIAKELGIDKPYFHKLTKKSYREALNYLPAMSAGQISINHCHLVDFFRNTNLQDFHHISTYFSDAVFGWECKHPKSKNKRILSNEAISNIALLREDIRSAIIQDSLNVFSDFDPKSNFSSADEFKYVTERSQKFHMLLAFLQGHYIKTNKVFADINLLKACLSVPTLFRQNKNIIDVILNRHFKSLSFSKYENISSRFLWGKGYAKRLSFIVFRFLNIQNSFLRFLTQGRFQFKNKYQTEEHERLLHANFKYDLHNATSKFLALGIFTEEQKRFFDKLPIRSMGVSHRYSLISLSKLL